MLVYFVLIFINFIKFFLEKPIHQPSDDLVEFECGQVLGPSPSSSADQIMLIEPILNIFSSNTQSFQMDNSNFSDKNSTGYSSRRNTAEKVILQNKKVKSSISLSPSLATSSTFKYVFVIKKYLQYINYIFRSQDSDNINKTLESSCRLFHAIPSISENNLTSVDNNQLPSEDYIDENEFEMSAIRYKPEKPSNYF